MGTPHSPKLQHYWSLTIRLLRVISRTLIGGVLLLCRDAVSVFYWDNQSGSGSNDNEDVTGDTTIDAVLCHIRDTALREVRKDFKRLHLTSQLKRIHSLIGKCSYYVNTCLFNFNMLIYKKNDNKNIWEYTHG